jgi:Fe-S cluster assembly iron-binding protein IscA
LQQIMTKDANPHLALRITVESGGCHGFQYLMSLINLPPSFTSHGDSAESSPAPNISPSDPNALSPNNPFAAPPGRKPTLGPDSLSTAPSPAETESTQVAQFSAEDDTVFEATDGSGAKVVMDEPSLELLKGSKIDYTMELIGSQFKIVDNPLATSSCGCGTSFDIKA